MSDDDLFLMPPEDMMHEPHHRVVAGMPGLDEAAAAIGDLVARGVAKDEIYVLCGEEGLRRLDPTGTHHGLKGRIIRAGGLLPTDEVLEEYAEHLERGGVLVSVPARDDEERNRSQDALRAHGASAMRYYGFWTHTDVG